MKSINENILKNIVMQAVKTQMSAAIDLEAAIQNALHGTEIKTEAADIKKQIDQALANIVYIKSNRVRMTADFAKGTLNEDEYEIVREQFESDLQKENEKLELYDKKRERFNKLLAVEKWVTELKKHTSTKKLSSEIVSAFIKQIKIYSDKRIEIVWKYEERFSEYQVLLDGGEKIAE